MRSRAANEHCSSTAVPTASRPCVGARRAGPLITSPNCAAPIRRRGEKPSTGGEQALLVLLDGTGLPEEIYRDHDLQ